MAEQVVSNVSDTARWVAVLRAWETARPDALFRDPFAERLGGERGKRIAESFKRVKSTANGWPVITRTKLIDDLVLRSIGDGCDCVLNLAAGLDTRPYRLALPPHLTWVEADLPAIMEEKTQALAGEKPACRLRVEKVDLANAAARLALFDDVSRSAKQVLVITEGLVVYLEEEQVKALGRDIHARESFRYWMLDVSSPAILAMMQKGYGSGLANAPMKFGPAAGIAFFEQLGFSARDIRSLMKEAIRLRRTPWYFRPFLYFPEPDPRHLKKYDRWAAVVRFERALDLDAARRAG